MNTSSPTGAYAVSARGGRRMSRSFFVVLCFAIITVPTLLEATNPPAVTQQAAAFAAQSIAALTGGNVINDVTLTGTVTWTSGSDTETGTASLMAAGNGESLMNLTLTTGTRVEIRDSQTGVRLGKWIAPSGTSGMFVPHNCGSDAVWFFPALSSLAGGANITFSYVAQETRNGESVQHIEAAAYQVGQTSTAALAQLGVMDFYLDSSTLLPSAITFNVHPDNNTLANIPVEVDFSDYQAVNGITVPMHIQKYLEGTLMIDMMISSATFNTGLPLSNFTIN
jgi:hypothetical protein